MFKKVSRIKFLQEYPNFPHALYFRSHSFYPEVYNSYILYADNAKSTKGLCRALSKEMVKLISHLGYDEILCLGDSTTPWLFRTDHDYKPVVEALDYLNDKGISQSFNGAIKTDKKEMQEFLRHLFWLVRCNGVVFYPHFSDTGFNFICYLCKYGNFHFQTLNAQVDSLFNNVVKSTGFILHQGNRFSGVRIGARIKGRTITL